MVAVFSSFSGFMAGNRSTSLTLLASVRNMVLQLMPMPQPAVGVPCSIKLFIYAHGLLIISSFGLFFKKLLAASWNYLPHCRHCTLPSSLQIAQSIQSGPFGQRSHYLWVITGECGTDASHFLELPDKLIKESGCGPRWKTLNSFCHTDIIKKYFSFFSSERLVFLQLLAG